MNMLVINVKPWTERKRNCPTMWTKCEDLLLFSILYHFGCFPNRALGSIPRMVRFISGGVKRPQTASGLAVLVGLGSLPSEAQREAQRLRCESKPDQNDFNFYMQDNSSLVLCVTRTTRNSLSLSHQGSPSPSLLSHSSHLKHENAQQLPVCLLLTLGAYSKTRNLNNV